MKSDNDEQINNTLRRHQEGTIDWQHSSTVKDLHVWAERFRVEFKLHIMTPAVMIEHLRRNTNGHFRCGRNGFGLRNEIAISEDPLRNGPYWQVLGTLLHELLHAEQANIGKPGRRNYHNKQFRKRAAEFGLIVNQKGNQEYTPAPTPFSELLERHGVEMSTRIDNDEVEGEDQRPTPVGGSKLKLWTCWCKPRPVRVRVAIQDFQARCLKCGERFVKQ